MLSLEMMQHRWPRGGQHVPGLVEGIVEASSAVFAKYAVTSTMAVAHFMAQASEECGQGLEMTESLDYTSTRLRQVFPTHFTPAMAHRWQHNQKMIGEIAYGGRMGNAPPPSTDGYDFRGRGLSQVTGREGYTALQRKLADNGFEADITADFDLVIDPKYALECGVADWILCGCLPYAERDDIVGETKKLNGGTNGLVERRRQLRLWKAEFSL